MAAFVLAMFVVTLGVSPFTAPAQAGPEASLNTGESLEIHLPDEQTISQSLAPATETRDDDGFALNGTLSRVAAVSGLVVPPLQTDEAGKIGKTLKLEEDMKLPAEGDTAEVDADTNSAAKPQAAKKEAASQSAEEKALKATIALLRKQPNMVSFLQTEGDAESRVTLRTVYNAERDEAGLYWNDREFIRFRSSHNGLTPYLRAKQAAYRLQQHAGELKFKDVHLETGDAGQYQLMLGAHIISEVDAETARSAKFSQKQLANAWKQQLRMVMGEPQPKPTLADSAIGDVKRAGRYLARGVASWYGPGFHGRTAADGSRYNMYAMTAAHKTLPFGTKVRVTNRNNGKSCIVRITDRGPFIHGRVIDLSKAAASAIGALSSGVANVTLEVLD